jgi:DTW domain-containing protein YfiP
MSTRRETSVRRCPRCRIHQQHCFCAHILPFTIHSRLSLIVHVRELKLTSNTAYFVQQMLPQNSHFDIRGRMNEPLVAKTITERSGHPLFLYPDENSQVLTPDYVRSLPSKIHLIIPDGSWHQARKVHQREPAFQGIQTVRLSDDLRGEYKLRSAPDPRFLSTYEAIAHALGVIEGQEVRDRLMAFFRVFVKSVWHSRHNFHGKLEL